MLRQLLAAAILVALPCTAYAADDEEADEADQKDEEKDDDDDEPSDADRLGKWHVLDFMTFGVGLVGNLGGNFLDKPSAADQTIDGVAYNNDADYPGFAGFTTGVGPMIEFRFFGYGGIEIDFLFQSDGGSAELEHTDLNSGAKAVFDVEISQSAVHIPLLFKGALPGEWVTPVIFVGPEFVIAGDAECKLTQSNGEGSCDSPPGDTAFAAQSEDYVAVAFGLGIEINFPVLPLIDLRIPFHLRGNFSPGAGSTREDRADHVIAPGGGDIQREIFHTAWQFQAAATFGVAWHF